MRQKFLFSILTCLFFSDIFASVQSEINKSSVAFDEMFTLTISSHDHLSISPDLEPLKRDFTIIGTNQNSQFNIVNGSTNMQVQWQIILLPKHGGDLVIPSLQVGGEKTQVHLIHVLAVKNNKVVKNGQNDGIYIEASITPKESFIQEHFVYTLKLYFDQFIENPYLIPPDLEDAKINQNGQDIIYSATNRGKYYRVVERSYLITPLKTGHFKIQPPVLKGYLERANVMDAYGFSSQTLKPIKIEGPTLEIQVKPKPANFVGQWLPAKKVTINDTWEPNPPIFRKGEPVTRIIEVTSEGASSEQIPNLSVSTAANLNNYPQQAKRDTDTRDGSQIGRLKQRIVFIPTASGKVIIPGIKLHWWNSQTQREEIASLDEKTIMVLPALTKNVTSHQTNPLKIANPLPKSTAKTGQSEKYVGYLWPIIAFLFIFIWMATVWLWRRQIKSQKNFKDPIKLLKEACATNDAKQVRILFLKWAITHWKDSTIHSLADVIHLLEREKAQTLISEIMKLEAIFYGTRAKHWQGLSFWHALNDYVINHEAHRHKANPEGILPSLYGENSSP